MIRINVGKLKGLSIKRPNIITTKETASMVREAVFNSLSTINGNVLDLFAGSGSYGFTAISCGASFTQFIDNNLIAFKTIKENIKRLGVEDNAKVYKIDYLDYLKNCKDSFEYIFLDPPFNFENYLDLLISVNKVSNKNTTIVLETDKRTKVIEEFEDFIITRNKTYGSKRIVIYKKVTE